MSRIKGSKNKLKPATEGAFTYSLEQRMKMVADLIVEKIVEDRSFGQELVSILNKQAGDDTK